MSAEPKNRRKAILLLNVGTPDKPEIRSVRKYLSEFLNDPFVIDLPWLFRKILVNLIIVPFRAPKSTKLYQQLWTKQGSPLLLNTIKLQDKLQTKIGGKDQVFVAMRYGNPSIMLAVEQIVKVGFDQVILVPLFPQYATSTSETAIQAVNKEAKRWKEFPSIKVVNQFYDHPEFINAWHAKVQEFDINAYDHILFSYHGLPLSHIQKIHPSVGSLNCNCTSEMPENGQLCYKATCYATTRLMVEKFGLKKEQYSVGFQSRLTKNWLSPFTDELIKDLAKKGKKKMLILSPAFVADCLETKVELGIEYAEMFREFGGEKLDLVESLNDSEVWVDALDAIIRKQE